MPSHSIPIAVFVSGEGTTLQALLDHQSSTYEVALVVANRACRGLVRAEACGIPCLQTRDWNAIDVALQAHQVHLIVLAGFLAIVPEWLCTKWSRRIINTHPSLLPKYGGKGMYGSRVQEAVLAAHETEAGCTIHYVSADVDAGAILAQAKVAILADDTVDSLTQRIQAQERALLPKVVSELVSAERL